MDRAALALLELSDALTAGEHLGVGEVAGALEVLAEETGQRDYARAARALFHSPPGRPPIDDSKALHAALNLVATGRAKSLHDAFMRVAKGLDQFNAKAVAERLRRKHARMKIVPT